MVDFLERVLGRTKRVKIRKKDTIMHMADALVVPAVERTNVCLFHCGSSLFYTIWYGEMEVPRNQALIYVSSEEKRVMMRKIEILIINYLIKNLYIFCKYFENRKKIAIRPKKTQNYKKIEEKANKNFMQTQVKNKRNVI